MPPDIVSPDARRIAARAELSRLWARGTAFLGCEVAIMGGAMSWVSERHLVSAISNAGGFGVIACGAMGPELLERRDRRHPGDDQSAVRRQPDHHASAAGRPGAGLHRRPGGPCGAGRRHPAQRRRARGQGRRREADRLRPGPGAGQAAGAVGRGRAGDRGQRGRRPYRAGVADRAGAGDSAASARRAGVRRRRAGAGRGDPVVSGDGRIRGAARHPLRGGGREHRA